MFCGKCGNKLKGTEKFCTKCGNKIPEKQQVNQEVKQNEIKRVEEATKEYVVITFLAILNMSKKQELIITQENNFENIIVEEVRK